MSVNIRKSDYFKLPDHCRRIENGRPHVLTSICGNKQIFIPANIL